MAGQAKISQLKDRLSGPAERTFHAFDGRLGLAARREGFRVLPAPT